MPHFVRLLALVLCLQLLDPVTAWAQLSDGARAAILINNRYTVFPDLTYGRASNYELKLDLYSRWWLGVRVQS
jgi:hypothetical protein